MRLLLSCVEAVSIPVLLPSSTSLSSWPLLLWLLLGVVVVVAAIMTSSSR